MLFTGYFSGTHYATVGTHFDNDFGWQRTYMGFYNIKGKLQRNLHVFSTFTQNLNLEHFILNVSSV